MTGPTSSARRQTQPVSCLVKPSPQMLTPCDQGYSLPNETWEGICASAGRRLQFMWVLVVIPSLYGHSTDGQSAGEVEGLSRKQVRT